MGDRYTWMEPCPVCGRGLMVNYAESCHITDCTCLECGTVFDVTLNFKLVPRKKEPALSFSFPRNYLRITVPQWTNWEKIPDEVIKFSGGSLRAYGGYFIDLPDDIRIRDENRDTYKYEGNAFWRRRKI